MAWTNTLAVFTKPWREDSFEALARRVSALGFGGVELPVREGFQVSPGNYESALPRMKAALDAGNIRILSAAGPMDQG
jgi:sugar phosphate isomerase/epimerase